MKHLERAKDHIDYASHGKIERAQLNTLLAIAHALTAICERMDRATKQEDQVSQEDQDAAGWEHIDDNLL